MESIPLHPRTVADFYSEVMGRLRGLGLETRIWTMPVEKDDAIPFDGQSSMPRTIPNMSIGSGAS